MSPPCLVLLTRFAGQLMVGEVSTPRPIGSTQAPHGYLEYLPPGCQVKGKARHPLVFFLRGLGELGDSARD